MAAESLLLREVKENPPKMQERLLSQQSTFSVVSAVYNSSLYLEEFFGSLERQNYGIENLDIVLVDDGSIDASLAMCQAFATRWPANVRVLHKDNGGQGTARNLGLDLVSGDWVCFVDPDDMLHENYFTAVSNFLDANSDSNLRMLATPLFNYHEETGKTSAQHSLHFKFAQGQRVIDLRVEAENIQLSSSSAFFSRQLIHDSGIRFDARVRPTFEDAHFVARYLVESGEPVVGLVSSAKYLYRKRAAKSSAVDTSYAHPGKYTDVPRHGYIDALRQAELRLGEVPLWLQYTVLYDLVWSFRADAEVTSSTGSLPAEVLAEFHELVAQTLTYISEHALETFNFLPVSDDIRFALTYGYGRQPKDPESVRFSELDVARGLALIKYRFAGDNPDEAIYVDSVIVDPIHSKVRSIEYFGRILARERIVWVPLGAQMRVFLNERPVAIGTEVRRLNLRIGRNEAQRRQREAVSRRPERFRNPKDPLYQRARRLLRREYEPAALRNKAFAIALHSGIARRTFANAWVFMDRDTDAGDSAESLYRYVAHMHPEINAWFVINRDAPDWNRLKREGVRVVAYGSLKWRWLMLYADHLASSHADQYVMKPYDTRRFGEPRWRFTFLQHGVIKDDLSRWLNHKRIDLFVTASPAEYHSIVDDDTPYAFTSNEVILSGLPRHDSLLSKRDAVPAAERNYILIMPTWRHDLVGKPTTSSTKRTRNLEFAESEYAKRYTELLNSDRLASLARDRGLELVFMPHPTMGPYLEEFAIPENMTVIGYNDADVQQILARAALLITDYSSMAFNTAMLNVHTVYYQFDREKFYSGSHPSRKGYFSYEEHGFGPVCETLEDVEAATYGILSSPSEHQHYGERMKRAFAHHDTNNSARVFAAMNQLNVRYVPAEPHPIAQADPEPSNATGLESSVH